VTTGDESQDAARGGDAAEDEHAALVARLRDELEAARRRVRDAWAQYQQHAADEHTRQAVALPPLVSALLGLLT
jgi:type VI protein secretion system component VasF